MFGVLGLALVLKYLVLDFIKGIMNSVILHTKLNLPFYKTDKAYQFISNLFNNISHAESIFLPIFILRPFSPTSLWGTL